MSNRPVPTWLSARPWLPWLVAITVVLSVTVAITGQLIVNVIDKNARYNREHTATIRTDIADMSKADEMLADEQARVNVLQSRNRALDKVLGTLGREGLPNGAFARVLPPCELEDGSTQDVCLWDGRKQGNGVGAVVINIGKGKLSYFPQTDGWVVN